MVELYNQNLRKVPISREVSVHADPFFFSFFIVAGRSSDDTVRSVRPWIWVAQLVFIHCTYDGVIATYAEE